MTEQLLGKQSRLRAVLEIGTGSGFQTSVLSKLVDRVYTIERVGPLFRRARKYFSEQGIDNIFLRHADGTAGWPTRRPFDGVIVTAATPQIPQALFAQLSEGGTLVAPEGAEGKQKLSAWKKIGRQFQHQSFEDVTFVPLVTGVEH
jgi:protein-L-isoaspartate(D-aspartate) O-methyltransferase